MPVDVRNPNLGKPSYRQGFARGAALSQAPGLWRGLMHAWAPLLGPTGTTVPDWGSVRIDGTLSAGLPPTNWTMSEFGDAVLFVIAEAGQIEIASFDPPHIGSVTVLFNKEETATSVRHRLIGGSDTYEFQIDTSEVLRSDCFAAASDGVGGVDLTANGALWHCMTATYDFTNGGEHNAYFDGPLVESNLLADSDPGGPFTLMIGHRTGRPDPDHWGGHVAMALIHERMLDANEAAEIAFDPAGMFRLRRKIYKLPAGAEFPSWQRNRMRALLVR